MESAQERELNTNMTVQEAIGKKENHVSAVKLIAAYLVMIGHSFAFACNYAQKDFMAYLTGDSYNLGGFAVGIFFFFSGLFITKGLLEGKYNAASYFKRRIFRIFPSFLLVTAAIICISGIFFTSLSAKEYFTSPDTWKYLLNCIFITVHELPAVFEKNIYGAVVNGPIWTIKVEFLCYIGAYLLYAAKLLNKKAFQMVIYLYAAGCIWLYTAGSSFSQLVVLVIPVGMFLIGMMYAVYGEYIYLSWGGFGTGVLVYAVLLFVGLAQTGLLLTLPYLLCCIGFLGGRFTLADVLDRLGKYSYEMYLWGGFAAQAAVSLFGGSMSVWLNMLITMVSATILGIMTKKITERKMI